MGGNTARKVPKSELGKEERKKKEKNKKILFCGQKVIPWTPVFWSVPTCGVSDQQEGTLSTPAAAFRALT